MIDNVKNWSYPFAGANGNPLANLTSLAKTTSGFYPMGANGLWHGGVHFDQGTAGAFDQSSVRCIADGEVIAYRIDNTYPISEYLGDIPQLKQARFSTGFVLVKHRLALPPLSSEVSTTPPPALTFYSLYMHLQDWAGYHAQPDLPRPSFWGKGIYQVKTNTTDPVLGLNVRGHHRVPVEHAQYSAYRTILCTLPRGTRIEVDEVSPDGNWLKLVNVTPLAAGLTAATGWVFKGQLKSLGGKSYLIAEQARDAPPSPPQGLNVRASANSTSDILAVLPHGTQVKISSEAAASKYHKLLEVVRGDPVPALIAKEDGELPGFVWRDSLESKSEPKTKGSVVVLESPVPIKAGDLIGHLGLYQNHNEGSPQAILHLEVFSCEDVPAFIAQSRAHAARLPETQKTLLKVHKGASKLIPHHAGINAANPPKLSDDGVTVGVDLILPQILLDSLPADAKLVVPASTGGTTCRPEIRWWRLDNLLADEDGKPISGWLAEQDMITTRHSPWEWEGYDFIEDSERQAGALAYHLEAMRRLNDSERASYQGVIDQTDKGPIKQRLISILDSNTDKKITAEEVRAALGKPWHAQSIAQLITRYESEWLWNPAKWDELDDLMEHRSAEPNLNWAEEKKRIETLSWWTQMVGKHEVNASGVVWHFQPITVASTFSNPCPRKCQRETYELETTAGTFVVSKKLFEFILEIESYSELPYTLPDETSGITIAYGYDLGQQTAETVDKELTGLYTANEIETLKTALGKKGEAARNHLPLVSSIAISKENALKLAVIMKKRYAQQVIDIYPKTINLHPDCQGALLSLVINRGKALAHRDPENTSRLEMKQIQTDLKNNKTHLIPSRLRSMKRLWENNPAQRGVANRRENEAIYFEEALKCNCWR